MQKTNFLVCIRVCICRWQCVDIQGVYIDARLWVVLRSRSTIDQCKPNILWDRNQIPNEDIFQKDATKVMALCWHTCSQSTCKSVKRTQGTVKKKVRLIVKWENISKGHSNILYYCRRTEKSECFSGAVEFCSVCLMTAALRRDAVSLLKDQEDAFSLPLCLTFQAWAKWLNNKGCVPWPHHHGSLSEKREREDTVFYLIL